MRMPCAHATLRRLSGAGPEYAANFAVDVRRMECLIDGDALRCIGVAVEGRRAYTSADGTAAEFDHGFAWLRLLGDETAVKVLFGDPGSGPILGSMALDGLGLVVDARTNALVWRQSRPLKRLGAGVGPPVDVRGVPRVGVRAVM